VEQLRALEAAAPAEGIETILLVEVEAGVRQLIAWIGTCLHPTLRR
jgi:hypothetical protein